MGRWTFGQIADGFLVLAQQAPAGEGGRSGNWGWLADPRTAVLIVLASVVLIGGGRRLLMAARARKAVERLNDPKVSPEEILETAEHGRAGLIEYFRLLAEGETPEIRAAAGRALATVWARDDLIPEEEKAVLNRGFDVRWRARRRYPRAIATPIPIEVSYGLPFLADEGPGIAPDDLEWSHRVAGAERAALELPSDWHAGSGRAAFSVDPRDFPTNGPHRLILKAKARTAGSLSSRWEVELPHVPFPFEFDPSLSPGALFTLPDEAKGRAIAEAIRLEAPASPGKESFRKTSMEFTEDWPDQLGVSEKNSSSRSGTAPDDPRFLDLPGAFVLRDPPVLRIRTPLPSDLAHRVEIEFEGITGQFPAGKVVVANQGETARSAGPIEIALGPVTGLPPDAFDGPGERRLRVVLRPDPDLGWADPDIRSLWPEPIETDWQTVRIIRR